MTERAALYARVSSDEQRNNYSIPTQIDECLKYAKEKGYSIVGKQWIDPRNGHDASPGDGRVRAYVDDYTSLEINRPSLNLAISYLEDPGFDVLLVHSLDRLARDPYIRKTIELKIEQRNGRVEYILGQYDDTPEGEVRKDLEATFGKWENAKRVERSKRGKRGKAKLGKIIGARAPYGYSKDSKSSSGLSIDQEQADTVHQIFNLYVNEGRSIRWIADSLSKDGVKTHQGGDNWALTSIARILRNETYVGRSYYGKTQMVKGRRMKSPRSEWIEIKVPQIIDHSIFELAKERLHYNKVVMRQQGKRFYLLSGKLFCADCGRAYVAQTSKAGHRGQKKDTTHYRERKDRGGCRNHQIAGIIIEPIVWEIIKEALLDPKNLFAGYQEALKNESDTRVSLTSRISQLEGEGEKLLIKLDKLTYAYLDPDLGMKKSEYIRLRDELEGARAKVLERIREITHELDSVLVPMELESLETFVSEIRERLKGNDGLTPEEKREILDLLHIRTLINGDRQVWIEGWIGESLHGPMSIQS